MSFSPRDDLQWRHASPFVLDWRIDNSVIDHYGHVNNVAYLSKIEALAWAHSNDLGLTIQQYQQIDRGMVIKRHEIDYILPCHVEQTIACATWIVACDGKLSLTREFEFICRQRQRVVFSARTEFVCIALSSGAPKRMPTIFKNIYAAAVVERR